jgi:OOP family OmpA-OmpF porin
MQRLALKLGTLSAVGLLSACANGPGFYSLPEAIMLAFPAVGVMNEARGTTPSGAYETAAYTDLMKHAEYEYVSMGDFKDAIYHARKAIAVAGGQDPAPQNPSERVLPADTVAEIQDAYTRLNAAYAAGGKTKDPEAAGVALGSFDCWIEQQEENFQPADIAACRDAFFAALAKLEEQPAQMGEMISLSSDVFFDFDKYNIKPDAAAILDDVAELLVGDTTTNILVWGHTDTAGPAAYNMALSIRRANAVANYLETKGVALNRMSIEGFGETKLLVPTPDNTPNAENRRVEIRRR